MTLKTGYDVAGVGDLITVKLNTLKFDDDSLLFSDKEIITGEESNVSIYSGVLGFFSFGDLIRVEEGLRKQPSWAVHEAFLMITIPGETKEAKDKREEMVRIITNYIDEHSNFETNGFKVYLADDKPVQRIRVSSDNPNVNKMNMQWNTGVSIKLEVGISKQP